MGKRLKRPVTTKKNFHGENQALTYAGSSMQGWRPTMEDSHKVSLSLPTPMNDWAFAGVFDGHGGVKVSKYISRYLMRKIVKNIPRTAITNNNEQEIKKGIKTSFLKIDQEMRTNKKINDQSGSTAVCVLVSPTHYYFINCGDSRAVLCRQEKVRFATRDHKPTLKKEEKRIVAAGGAVRKERVEGRLALSRALGDFEFKNNTQKGQTTQMVIPQPDIKVIERNNQTDHFIVLACDGIYDVMSNPELLKLIKKEMGNNRNLTQVCKKVVDHCLEIGSGDNMSIVILKLPGCPTQDAIQAQRKLNLTQMHLAIRAKKRKAQTSGSGNPKKGKNVPVVNKSGGDGANKSGEDGANKSGGDGASKSGGDGANKSGEDGANKSGGDGASKSGGDCANKSGGDGASKSGGDGASKSGGDGASKSGGDGASKSGGDGANKSGGDGASKSGGDGANNVAPSNSGGDGANNVAPNNSGGTQQNNKIPVVQKPAANVNVLRRANPFLVYFVQYWKRHGGNVCRIAKRCGARWNRDKEQIQKSQLVQKTISKKGKTGRKQPRKIISNAKAQLIKQTIKKSKK